MSVALRTQTLQTASARVVAAASVQKDARTDKASQKEADRKAAVAASMARLEEKSKNGTVADQMGRMGTGQTEAARAASEEKAARARVTPEYAKAHVWVTGYYRTYSGQRIWVDGYWQNRDPKKKLEGIKLTAFRKAAGTTDEQRLVLTAVYMPDIKDSQGDYMTAEEIRKSMWDYMAKGDNYCVDLNHDGKVTSCQVVECFLARKGDPDFPIEGTWVVGIYVPDDALWAKVKKGELNGVSMEGIGRAVPRDAAPVASVEILCKGATADADEHNHTFEINLDTAGRIVGGRTSVHKAPDGTEHYHEIVKGVVTEEAGGHRHRFNTLGAVSVKKDDLSWYDKHLEMMAAAAKKADVAAYVQAYLTIHPNMRGEAHKRAIEAIIHAGAFDKYLASKGAFVTPKQRVLIQAAKRAGNLGLLTNIYGEIEPAVDMTAIRAAASTTIDSFKDTATAAALAAKLSATRKDLLAAKSGDAKALARALKQMRGMDYATLKKLGGAYSVIGDGRLALLDAIYQNFSGGKKAPLSITQKVLEAGGKASEALTSTLRSKKPVAPKTGPGQKALRGAKVWWNDERLFESALKDMKNWPEASVRRAHNLLTGKFGGGTKDELISSIRAYRSKQVIAARVAGTSNLGELPPRMLRPHATGEKYFVKPYQRTINGKVVDVSGYWIDPTDPQYNAARDAERVAVAQKAKLKPAIKVPKTPPVSAANKMIKVKPAVRVPTKGFRPKVRGGGGVVGAATTILSILGG